MSTALPPTYPPTYLESPTHPRQTYRVHTTKIVMECMETSLQHYMHSASPRGGCGMVGDMSNSKTGGRLQVLPQPGTAQLVHVNVGGSPRAMKGGGGGMEKDTHKPLDIETVREVLYAVTLALDYLHHKLIVHLDVK